MGMQVGGKSGGPKSEINVTPLVDIVLVMLIIFLVMTPIMMHQITIEIPRKLDADEDPTVASKQLTVLVRADGTVKISDGRLTRKTSGGESIYHSMKVAPGAVESAGSVQTICARGLLLANKNKLTVEQSSKLTELINNHWARVHVTTE